jgi:hypothetical protein
VAQVELSFVPFDRLRAIFSEFNGSFRRVVVVITPPPPPPSCHHPHHRHVVSEELSGNFGAQVLPLRLSLPAHSLTLSQFIDSRIAAYEDALGAGGSTALSASELRGMARTGAHIIAPRSISATHIVAACSMSRLCRCAHRHSAPRLAALAVSLPGHIFVSVSLCQIQSLPRYTDPEDSLEQQEIQVLLEDVEAVELVSDSLFRLDASMVSNDHNYFVFEDLLHDVSHVTRPRCRVTC